jgi:hypothetical protein
MMLIFVSPGGVCMFIVYIHRVFDMTLWHLEAVTVKCYIIHTGINESCRTVKYQLCFSVSTFVHSFKGLSEI